MAFYLALLHTRIRDHLCWFWSVIFSIRNLSVLPLLHRPEGVDPRRTEDRECGIRITRHTCFYTPWMLTTFVSAVPACVLAQWYLEAISIVLSMKEWTGNFVSPHCWCKWVQGLTAVLSGYSNLCGHVCLHLVGKHLHAGCWPHSCIWTVHYPKETNPWLIVLLRAQSPLSMLVTTTLNVGVTDHVTVAVLQRVTLIQVEKHRERF